MNPLPPPLVQPGREWTMQQIYWITAHGVHMTGMPAFMFRMPDADLWAVAAWVKQMPDLTPDQYAARRERAKAQAYRRGGSAASARRSRIPSGADWRWPSTAASAATSYRVCRRARNRRSVRRSPASAGAPSSPERWKTTPPISRLSSPIRKPCVPHGAMPDMRVDPRDAADIVAYLRSLRTP